MRQKTVAILGMGVEGESARSYFTRHDYKVEEVKNIDDADVEMIRACDLIIKSPGIAPTHPLIKNLQNAKVDISSVTKYFFQQSPTKNIIGVTGTKGKGTTSTLIHQILKRANYDAYLGGNIGTPALDFIDQLTQDSWVVLELSSFQLMDLEVSPHIAVVLMTTSEHLNWHRDVDEYVAAKAAIVKHQKKNDAHIVNIDYSNNLKIAESAQSKRFEVSLRQVGDNGCFVRGHDIIWIENGQESVAAQTEDVRIPGRHNLENVCAALAASHLAGASKTAAQQAVASFTGLEHRIEKVATVEGVAYYDDSFSTTPETTIAAIRSFDAPKVLVLGGSSKNSDFHELAQEIIKSNSIRTIIGIGDEWRKIKESIEQLKAQNTQASIQYIEGLSSMKDIVAAAQKVAQEGDVVLLSPACASFGMFANYKDRGDQFKKEVNSILHI